MKIKENYVKKILILESCEMCPYFPEKGQVECRHPKNRDMFPGRMFRRRDSKLYGQHRIPGGCCLKSASEGPGRKGFIDHKRVMTYLKNGRGPTWIAKRLKVSRSAIYKIKKMYTEEEV
jgi:hypothetical protein